MNRLLVAPTVLACVWLWRPFPPFGADPVAALIADRSPGLHDLIRAWNYLGPAVAAVIAWSVAVATGRVWFAGWPRGRVRSKLPAGVLEDVGRGGDDIELGMGGRWQWDPLGDDELDSYSVAYTIASLINQLFGRSEEPFWQPGYVNLVRWIIELHRMSPRPWVMLRDGYRGTLDAELVKRRIAEVEAGLDGPSAIRVPDCGAVRAVGRGEGLGAWEPAGDGVVRAKDDPKLREQLKGSGVAFDVVRLGRVDLERRERLGAVKALARAGLAGARPETALEHRRGAQRLPVGLRPAGRRARLLSAGTAGTAAAARRGARRVRRRRRPAVAAARRGDRLGRGPVPQHVGRDNPRCGGAAQAGLAPDAAA